MSHWKTVLENEISKIRTLNYPKLNVVQQRVADCFEKESLSTLEVSLILAAMIRHEMLNQEIATQIFRTKNAALIAHEGFAL